MKLIIAVALALVAVAVAAPAVDEPIPIVRSEFQTNPEGSYIYSYETGDGSKREETGELKEALDEEKKPHNVITVRGSYTYNGADGKPVTVTYYADETGFHAVGDTIPKSVNRR